MWNEVNLPRQFSTVISTPVFEYPQVTDPINFAISGLAISGLAISANVGINIWEITNL